MNVRSAGWAALLFGAVWSIGCTKPEDDIGLELLDPSEALGTTFTDTARVIAWTEPGIPLGTTRLSRTLLGTYLDNEFGMVTAGLITQLRLSSSIPQGTSNTGLVCDSIVLSLAYDASGFGYGTAEPQAFRVFRLAEDLDSDTGYQSNHVPQVYLDDIQEGDRHTYPIQPLVSPVIAGVTQAPQLRIRLESELGQSILGKWGQTEMTSNEAFLAWFKGLMLLPAEEPINPFQQAILYFNLQSAADSRVRLYYHDQVAPETPLTFDMPINTNCVRYTLAAHDHSRALEPGLPTVLADSTQGQQEFYVQALGGLQGRVQFPNLAKYASQGALAKAELIVPVDADQYPVYAPPASMFVYTTDEDGDVAGLLDYISTAGYRSEPYDAVNHEYSFTITRWAQNVMDGQTPNNALNLLPGSNGVTVNRAVIFGPAHAERPMKLRLTFTSY